MMFPVVIFAQLEGLNPLNPTAPVSKSSGLLLKDVLLIIGIGLVLASILVLGARFYMRHKQQRRNHHHQEHKPVPAKVANDSEHDEDNPRRSRRHRRRRHRRDHRPRNPTLAETGGLPPAKPEAPPPQTP